MKVISVITINYNNYIGLEKTILSVLAQNYLLLNFIVIDGSSTDSSLDIIKKYSDKISFYISESDLGIFDAMNKGIFYSKGDYLFFLNSGDIFSDNNVLLNISRTLNYSDVDFLYGDSIELDKFNSKLYKKARGLKYIYYGMFTHHQSMFFSKNILTKHKIIYSMDYLISSDWLFTYKFLKNSQNILYTKIPICIFERGGISSNFLKSIKEVYKIRRYEFNTPLIINLFFCFLQISVNTFRYFSPFFYDIIKFKKIK
jgi:putative colanic acid biosynthesis glycosyltransferase